MWTFRPAATVEDDLRVKLRAERKAKRAALRAALTAHKRGVKAISTIINTRDELAALLDEAAEREKEFLQTAAKRDSQIEELEIIVRLREEEIKGLASIINRDRQRVEAETAIEVARAETAARRIQGEQRHQHGFLP